jgi:hypothetical protein
MTHFPEVTETIRNVLPVQVPGPARVAWVTVRRSHGAPPVSFYEIACAGQVTTCEDREGAYGAARRMSDGR